MQRSGTGSQMNIGFVYRLGGQSVFLLVVMSVTNSLHREGEHMRWKDLESNNVGVRSLAVKRFLGVVYLNARLIVVPVSW